MASEESNFTPFMAEGAEPFSSRVQSHYGTVEAASHVVLATLDNVTLLPGQPFVIGEYGAADGGTSYSLMQEIIARLRNKYGTDFPIQIVYEDQPINDFKPAFLRAQGLVPGVRGLTSQFPNVYVTATGCSFYAQCMPPRSLDFVVCFNAAHWLSKSPDICSATLFPTNADGPARDAFEKQAEEDWETFLLMRAAEMKHGEDNQHIHNIEEAWDGGYLIVGIITGSPHELVVGSRAEDIMARSTRIWQGMLEDGFINKDEFEHTQFAFHIRCQEDLGKPFKGGKSLVSMSGLKLVSMEQSTVRTDFNNQTEDKEQVQKYIDEQRTWQETTLLRGLGDHRPKADKQAIINAFYERYSDLLVRESVMLRKDYVQNVLVIIKDNLISRS